MLIKEKGKMTGWSLEDKAWYTQMMIESGLMGFDEHINSLPGKDDIPRERAIEIAGQALTDAYGWPKDALDKHDICVDFCVHSSLADKYDPYYIVTFFTESAPEGVMRYMQCDVTRDGRVMDSGDGAHDYALSPAEQASDWRAEQAEKQSAQAKYDQLVARRGPVETWTIGQKAAVAAWPLAEVNAFWGSPLETDISEDAAIAFASKALQGKYPVTDEALKTYAIYVDFITGINANTEGAFFLEGAPLPPPPFYIVSFAAPGHDYGTSDYFVVVQPQDGYVPYVGARDTGAD